MSLFKVSPGKEAELFQRMAKLGIRESDITENFIRGSGKGGQKINKTSSCVQLIHRPSGIQIRCQRERSQSLNRFFARRELCDKVEQLVLGAKSRKQQEIEKIRRQKRRRSRRSKEHTLFEKRRTSEKKSFRKSVKDSE